MSTLNFADLKAEADKKHAGGLKFVAANGKKIRLRRIEAVPAGDLQAIMQYMDVMQSEKVSDARRIEAMGNMVVAASSDKKAMRASVDALPLDSLMTICEAWMEEAAPGEASA
ncbi:hypothetical protein [Kitasatospora sp. McL0602]|uniref:hypothetical protein n=1 Tax=Kitasatospora sp. McL0602 TaxID=3439530 RepID=UPI003F8B0952